MAALMALGLMAAPAAARLPDGDVVPQRLDGSGVRAFARFRMPETRCGLTRDGAEAPKIYNSFAGAILKLRFGGTTRRVLPLLMTDKPGEGQILKVKIRTACLLDLRRDGEDWLLHVTARVAPPGLEATLRVNAEGQLLNPQDNAGVFYVVGENSRAARTIDRFALLEARLYRFTCLRHESDAACDYQFLNYAERLFADEIRHQSALPAAGRKADHAVVEQAVAATVHDPTLLALHRLIVANESATISPFQIWDAVLADSGLSFGPHQWDIGINAQGQKLFIALAQRAGVDRPERYLRSMWRLSTADFRDYLLWRPAMDRVLQSPEGESLVIEAYLTWLKTESLANARAVLGFLDPGRAEDRVMLLYYADADNQYGDGGLKRDLRQLIRSLKDQAADRAAIRAALDARMLVTPFAVAWPDKAAARLERTWAILNGL